MSSYCFIAPDALELIERAQIKENIESFSEGNKKQTYVLCRPLSKDDATYDYDDAVVIFSSGHRPFFIDLGNNPEAFEEYKADFLEDVSFLSEKFKYREKIGRKKNWMLLFETLDPSNLNIESLAVQSPPDGRRVDLITSLVVGSINDVSKISLEATDLLESVKSKIILFDTDQTSFVFRSSGSRKFVIQGLAGSGKTELLLHKMKEIYSNDLNAKIAFTCYNKILASSMKDRIPVFFDFMRVERQIDWNKKLFCFHSWGSGRDPHSGMYRYICHHYEIPFGSLQAGSFDSLCKKAIKEISAIQEEKDHIFDYVFIDESQDFPKSFIDLCEMTTKKRVFVAGDVFQNIFRPFDDDVNGADMVLKKCYRTDPKNLMFSHALGMGLFETPVLRWLKPNEWDSCGYKIEEKNDHALLSRDPLRRFEDIPNNFESTRIYSLKEGQTISDSILDIVQEIKSRHQTLKQGDIAVIFLDKDGYIYDAISDLKIAIKEKFNWDANISFESKNSHPDKFFISNINNAKGLEFPFVICFAANLNRNPSFRNALYTMMARSFLESHLVLGRRANTEVLSSISIGLEHITQHGVMNVRIPSPEEIASQKELIILNEQTSIEEHVKQFCATKSASPRLVAKLIKRMNDILEDSDYDEEYLRDMLEAEYKRNMIL
ncbi:DEAD/DEAH box helicase [Perlucidibaca piscinae]|uniref:DEAD/DEAH box helicase n=1 Tax=Perlucidibaca piscinae TaxID=392589 RepID=UPI00041819A3|nr:ATP-binding domain-containing protein [Perlucidibaca piscinae]